MFSSRHTSALSIQPSEVCGSNLRCTCPARADSSFSRSRMFIHVFSPIQITFSIVSIVFRLINRFLYMDRSLLIRPVSGALCFSSYRFALWPLSCGRVMFLPAIYVRCGQIVPFSRPLSLTVTDSPFLSGFSLRGIAAFHTLNAGRLRNVSRPAHRGTGWLRLATLWHRPGRNRNGQG